MKVKNEFEGKNLKTAVAKACKKLKKKEDELKYEIISHGSTGIFGLVGVKKAKIRISSHKKELLSKKQEKVNVNKKKEIIEEGPEDQERYNYEDAAKLGETVLKRIIDAISEKAEISIEKNTERIDFKVNGGKAGILIGKRGQTLEAIQLLVEKIINKHNKKRIRVLVDVEGYQQNRQENLRGLAKKLSEKAKRLKKPMSLGQMNALDRRTVHLALKSDDGVKTISSGEGYIKKIIIFPKD